MTGLRTAEHLRADLRSLSTRDDSSFREVLVALQVDGLDRYECEHGSAEVRDLLRELARRLTDAVAPNGVAYRIARDRFAILVHPGRGGMYVVTLAATAALSEGALGIAARTSTTVMPSELLAPEDAMRSLARGDTAPSLPASANPSVRSRPERAATPVGGAALAPADTDPRTTGATDHGTTHAAGTRRQASTCSAVGDRRRASSGDQRRDTLPTSASIIAAVTAGASAPAGLDSRSLAEARRTTGSVPRATPPLGLPYLRVITRFRLSVLCGLTWLGLCTWIALPWFRELAQSITLPGACLVICGIALIPGYLNVQLVTSLLMDRPTPLRFDLDYPALTLLVAAFNEQERIAQTIAYALAQDYPGPLQLMVIDDGSGDATADVAREFARIDDRVQVLQVPHAGKAGALNVGLAASETPLVATIDADTLLMPQALRRIVSRMLIGPPDTVAVAGSVLVRNSREDVVTRIQAWDYFLGIGSIKRQQALLQATLVAQGAFSVYDADALRAARGWPNCIGEDIVMTWALLDNGGRTTYEPTAVAFTRAPSTLRQLARQRRRWARGMIEGLRSYGVSLLRRHRTYSHSVLADAIFPYLDFAFTFAFIPGILLAAFGNFAIVGVMTLAVLPINALLAGIMYARQRASLREAELHVRRGPIGFVLFLFLYQLFMSPVSVSGYLQEVCHASRRW